MPRPWKLSCRALPIRRRSSFGAIVQAIRSSPARLGTQAPLPDQAILDPDLVILPLVGFDRTGVRLGHGRGYYDRAIAALAARGVRPTLVGIGFAAQEVEAIPAEPHDARLDWIVTENEALDLRRQEVRDRHCGCCFWETWSDASAAMR